MSTTLSPVTVRRYGRLADSHEAIREIVGGLGYADHVIRKAELEAIREDDDAEPAYIAWEKEVIDDAAAEIAPQVADMLNAAIERRLPWTWEPER